MPLISSYIITLRNKLKIVANKVMFNQIPLYLNLLINKIYGYVSNSCAVIWICAESFTNLQKGT